MWRRLYLCLVLVRLYFALCPSYIHPDEHFQGPEIIAGEIFGYPVYKTWEFTSAHPIRSIFPIWIFYGAPLTVTKWISEGLGYDAVSPALALYVLRGLMFLFSFVLGDWAIHELVPNHRDANVAKLLVTSSYVTWTYQTHTFSNSIETLIVLWSLVLAKRLHTYNSTAARTCCILAFLCVLGTFNRITFPAFLLLPLVRIIPTLYFKPLRLPIMLAAALFTLSIAVTLDTEYFLAQRPRVRELFTNGVVTPWNNLAYNMVEDNLAQHGLHPRWQHLAANLPQLLGPAFPLVFILGRFDTIYWTGVIGILILSYFPHQEPRFLLPAVPLLLSSIRIPERFPRVWLGVWYTFNALAGILFGVYHQGGVIPVQTWLSQQADVRQVYWWKTYSPPRWILDGANAHIETIDLMGMRGESMLQQVAENTSCDSLLGRTILVAPSSARVAGQYLDDYDLPETLQLSQIWSFRRHVGLDDLDFGDDGVWSTLERVTGRRGLDVWEISKAC